MRQERRRLAPLEGFNGPLGFVVPAGGSAEPDGVAADDDEAVDLGVGCCWVCGSHSMACMNGGEILLRKISQVWSIIDENQMG